jgi:uncharacterized protein (DUF58 family)
MIRPTSLSSVLLCLSIPLSILIFAKIPDQWPLSLFYPAFIFAVMWSDLIRSLPRSRVTVAPSFPQTLFVGRLFQLPVTVTVDWPAKILIETLLVAIGPLKPQEPIKSIFEQKGLLNIPLFGHKRGQIVIKSLWLRWQSPLKLLEIRSEIPLPRTVPVSQDIHNIHQDALNFFSRQSSFGSKIQPFRGEGSEFDCLTDFTPDMDNRYIDWKHTARHRKLLAREFRQERNHQIFFGFDTGRLMQEPVNGVTKLDRFVASALRLSWVSLQSGDLVGACGYDLSFNSFLKPSRGPRFFTRVQSFTACLAYSLSETNHTLALAELMQRLPHRALVILFTEFIDDINAELLVESLALLTRRHMVVFVTIADPLLLRLKNQKPNNFNDLASTVIADNFSINRHIVLERISRLGVNCLDVPAQDITSTLINRYLLIKQRGLL